MIEHVRLVLMYSLGHQLIKYCMIKGEMLEVLLHRIMGLGKWGLERIGNVGFKLERDKRYLLKGVEDR